MTLLTEIRIHQPVDLEILLTAVSRITGIPENEFHGINPGTPLKEEAEAEPGEYATTFGRGWPARTRITRSGRIFDDGPDAAISVTFDTAYGYHDTQGRDCRQLHAHYVHSLTDWCAVNNLSCSWRDEFTGQWHHDTATLNDFIHH